MATAGNESVHTELSTLELLLKFHTDANRVISGVQEAIEAGDEECLRELASAIARRGRLAAIRRVAPTGVAWLNPLDELASLMRRADPTEEISQPSPAGMASSSAHRE